jgi:hypothetical protein
MKIRNQNFHLAAGNPFANGADREGEQLCPSVLAVIAIGVFVALGVLSGSISGALDTISAEI